MIGLKDSRHFFIQSEVKQKPIGHVRYINIQAWLRGFRVKIANFSSFFCLSIPKRDLDTKKKAPNIEVWPESLGAMLEYWYIERGLLWLARMHFPALCVSYLYLLRVLIGSLYCLCPLWLARVITLVLVLRHSNENHSKILQWLPYYSPLNNYYYVSRVNIDLTYRQIKIPYYGFFHLKFCYSEQRIAKISSHQKFWSSRTAKICSREPQQKIASPQNKTHANIHATR